MEPRAAISGRFLLRSFLLLIVAGLTACKSSAEVKDDEIVRLPAEDRQALLDEQSAVNTAEANREASRVAVEEAKRFQAIVKDENEAAATNLEAADKSLSLQKDRADQQGAKVAEDRKRVAAQNRKALKAKGEYADRLRTLRERQHELREIELERANNKLERAQYDALKARGMAKDLDAEDFAKADRETERKYSEASQQVTQAEGYAGAAQSMWNEARQEAELTDQQLNADEKQIVAPPSVEPLPQQTEPQTDE